MAGLPPIDRALVLFTVNSHTEMTNLQVKLAEGHEKAVGKSNEQSANVQSGDMRGTQHDGIGNSAEETS